jgi:hypothetical protein
MTSTYRYLKKYDKILVTGPQRSGTRIAAKMIANDTGRDYVDENNYRVASEKYFAKWVKKGNCVIHCPAMMRYIHKYSADDTLIVVMIREPEDIIASQKRVDWHNGILDELYKYGVAWKDLRFYAAWERPPICILKYNWWAFDQKYKVKNYLELWYEDLAEHPMWIPKELRKDFTTTQTCIKT